VRKKTKQEDIISDMHKTLGYMLTWTTYGSWLQGDENGYVKDGYTYGENRPLYNSNIKLLCKEAVTLKKYQRKAIEDVIREKSDEIGVKIYALCVCTNHVHIVAEYTTKDLGLIVRYYKMAGQKAMREAALPADYGRKVLINVGVSMSGPCEIELITSTGKTKNLAP
jgi:hypothetical protein